MGQSTPTDEPIARDSRTGLADRDTFYRDVSPQVTEANAGREAIVLLVIDIEGIDFVLRTFGPIERDFLINEVGQRLHEATGGDGAAYHITQDRFTLVLRGSTFGQATRYAGALVDALHSSFEVSGVSYHLTCHVGISHCPNHADSVAELVRASVFACHQARTSEASCATFDRAWDERERHRFRLMLDLGEALERNNEIDLAYQPVVALETGCCTGLEALCRWQHPEQGPVPPGDFMPFVEQTPLMMPLTEATVDRALDNLATWRAKGFGGTVAINISPVLFRRSDFLERLFEHARFANVGLDSLHFEITETGIMDQPNRAAHVLGQLRDQGCSISVDDFGTGHSSLAYLADLPVDTIKIDKVFVQNMDRPWGAAVVGAAATLGSKLGLETVAEGIEHESDLHTCGEFGVTYAQGFHLARPMNRDAVEQWLEL